MVYYAGLDVSMEETHICVLVREGALMREGKKRSSPAMIAAFLADGPPCEQVTFETGRMAPMLYHGLVEQGVRVRCVERRQAYQALKSLAGHKADRNDARGLAQVCRIWHARGSANRPTSNPYRAHAIRSLIAARDAILTAVAAIDADMKRMARASKVCARLMTIPGVGPITALAFATAIDDPSRFRRSRDVGAYLGLVPPRNQSGDIDYSGSISKRGDIRGRQRDADEICRPSQAEDMGAGNRGALDNGKSQSRTGQTCRHRHACNDA